MFAMVRTGVLIAGAVLTAFHAWLFGSQAVAGRLAEADVAGRWVIALGLLAGLWALRHRGASSSTRRRTIALWVLATVLHGPALANDHDGFVTPALPAPATVAQAVASVAAVAAAVLLLLRHSVWGLAVATGLLVATNDRLLPARAPSRQLRFLPRPPPLV